MCTRVHCGNVADAAGFLASSSFRSNLRAWLQHAVTVATHVAIAVDCTDSRVDVADSVQEALQSVDGAGRVQLVRVAPWGRFVPALNALVQSAAAIDEVQCVYFTSLEAQCSADEVRAMRVELSSGNVMLVGLRLAGHEWHGPDELLPSSSSSPSASGLAPLSGVTCPWNTNALWSLPQLRRTGFLNVSEDAEHGGVEEVAVVATHAALHASAGAEVDVREEKAAVFACSSPEPLAVLIDFERSGGGSSSSSSWSSWKAEWEDAGRRAWHQRKMASKAERAKWQLQQIGLDAASSGMRVLHKRVAFS